jgi:hypothetical protein
MNHPVTVWLGAIITLCVLSYLIKDNMFYRLAQKLALGGGVGIGIVVTWQQVLKPYWWTPISGAFTGGDRTGALWLLVLIPGLTWYCQMSKKWFWLSRPVIGLFIGVAAGLAFKGNILLILPQLGAALRPLKWNCDMWLVLGILFVLANIIGLILTLMPGRANLTERIRTRGMLLLISDTAAILIVGACFLYLKQPIEWSFVRESVSALIPNNAVFLNNVVFMVALLTTLFYFCFTIKATNRIFRVPMKTGRLVIMVALGAMFGNTVMTRMSFLIERMQFLADFLLKPLFRQIGF